MDVGKIIEFGKYSWRILEVKSNKVLIITEEIIEQRDYHNKKEEVTWESSEVRNYLNSDFLKRFNKQEQEKVSTVVNINKGNPWYGSIGGRDTQDKVFLLSLDEVVRLYFGDSSKLLDNPRESQRYWFNRKDENNFIRKAIFLGSPWWWWIRTPGKNNKVASYVHGDGNIGIQGNGVSRTSFNTIHQITKSNEGGIRPALWLKTI